MDSYFVYSNLNHDGKEYQRGDKVTLPSSAAERLLELGVVGREKVEAAAPAPVATQEAVPEGKVGGEPESSGEPSIYTPEANASPSEAADVTPQVSDRMTRAELEEIADKEGIAKEAVAAADTKANLVDLIEANRNPATAPAPAESEVNAS